MFRKTVTLLLGLTLFCLTGCLLEEDSHTLYLAPDGSVTWRVLRDVIRSDEDDPWDREGEEAEFLATLDSDEEGWSELLDGYGSESTRVRLIRRERPYTVMVEAQFADVGDLVSAMLAESDEDWEVSYEEEGSLRILRVQIEPEEPSGADEEDDGESDSGLRLVLTQGRFIEAHGFRLSKDGVIAVPLSFESSSDEPLLLHLVWDVEA